MADLVYGWGVNDADYHVSRKRQIPGTSKRERLFDCPYYIRWKEMLRRCLCPVSLAKAPNYVGVKICDEWRNFTAFRSWMDSQQWEGMDLDKDILGDGLLYSPETCCFIPRTVNLFLTNCWANTDSRAVGIKKSPHGKFIASVNQEGHKVHLGHFDTHEQAHLAWCEAKIEVAGLLIAKTGLEERVSTAIMKKLHAKLNKAKEAVNV